MTISFAGGTGYKLDYEHKQNTIVYKGIQRQSSRTGIRRPKDAFARHLLPFIPPVLWLLVIFFLSTQNGRDTTVAGLWFTRFIIKCFKGMGIYFSITEELLNNCLRTVAHIGVFFVEGMLLEIALWSTAGRSGNIKDETRSYSATGYGKAKSNVAISKKMHLSPVISVLICLPLAIIDELHKLFIQGRHCQWDEIGLNVLGSTTGILLSYLLLTVVYICSVKSQQL